MPSRYFARVGSLRNGEDFSSLCNRKRDFVLLVVHRELAPRTGRLDLLDASVSGAVIVSSPAVLVLRTCSHL